MAKLTNHQQTLLAFFATGATVEICTSIGRCLGRCAFPSGKPEGFSKTILNSLLTRSLLLEREHTVYGLRWSVLAINERGTELIKLSEVDHETS
ncbi:hypothetical protein [uncultured Paraglaciecola sp.]|uniref:hypothetical protein n=1 Tax=uncultured Paraglaciecola sp. TaxID=1765024 RepID=UPI0025951ECC|nr:hypothetical protein [uncultured Paraglaciecola sp.]